MRKNKIVDTTQRDLENPFLALVRYGEPGGIEGDEARGQKELLVSTVLPTKLNFAKQEEFETLGFKFGDIVTDDPLFRDTTLPDGWKREGSRYSLWSYIVDARGLKRVSIFYKAVSYDRDAFMTIRSVGYNTATDNLYGETPVTVDTLKLSLMTPEEKKDLIEGLNVMGEKIKEFPDIYGKYRKRLAACRKLIKTIK